MSFSTPSALLLLIVIPAYYYYRLKIFKKEIIPSSQLQFKKSTRSLPWHHIMISIESLILLFAFIAMAKPYTSEKQTIISAKGIDIVFVLDISASMQADDFKPNRLDALKKVTSKFIKQSANDRIAIIVFAKHVFNQSPLTTDHEVLQTLVKGISYEMIDHVKSGGTRIGDALLSASDYLKKRKIKKRDQVIILISDGQSFGGVKSTLAAKYVRAENIRLYSIGIGSKEKVKLYVHGKPFITAYNVHFETFLDDTELKNIAEVANGKYYRATNKDILKKIFADLNRLESTPLKEKSYQSINSLNPKIARVIFFLFILWLALQFFKIKRPLR